MVFLNKAEVQTSGKIKPQALFFGILAFPFSPLNLEGKYLAQESSRPHKLYLLKRSKYHMHNCILYQAFDKEESCFEILELQTRGMKVRHTHVSRLISIQLFVLLFLKNHTQDCYLIQKWARLEFSTAPHSSVMRGKNTGRLHVTNHRFLLYLNTGNYVVSNHS